MNISFITIPTSSIDESVDFYTQVLGFSVKNRISPKEGIEIAFLTDERGGTVEFIQRPGDVDLATCPVSLGFEVDDIDSVKERLIRNKVPILSGPTEMGNGAILMQAKDINGFRLGFVQTA